MVNLILTMLVIKLNVSCFVQCDYTAKAVKLVKKARPQVYAVFKRHVNNSVAIRLTLKEWKVMCCAYHR